MSLVLFFSLICIHCIPVAERPSAASEYVCLLVGCCFFVFYSKNTSSAASDTWLVQDQAVLHLSFFPFMKFLLLFWPFWLLLNLLFSGARGCEWLAMAPNFSVCGISVLAFKIYNLHILPGRKILSIGYRIYIQTRPWLPFLLIVLRILF